MENNRGTVSHFTVIIRVIAFVVLIAILAFFAIRWVRARQDTNRANQAVTSQNEAASQEDGEEAEDTEEKGNQSERSSGATQEEDSHQDQSPQDIANTGVSTEEIPQVGMEDTLAMVLVVSGLAYATALYSASRKRLKMYAGE